MFMNLNLVTYICVNNLSCEFYCFHEFHEYLCVYLLKFKSAFEKHLTSLFVIKFRMNNDLLLCIP